MNTLQCEHANFKCHIIVYDENMLYKIVLCFIIFLSFIIHSRQNGNCSNWQNTNSGKFRILWIPNSNILKTLQCEDTNFKCQIIYFNEKMFYKIVLCFNIVFLSFIINLCPNGNCSNLQNMNSGKFRILWISHLNILTILNLKKN